MQLGIGPVISCRRAAPPSCRRWAGTRLLAAQPFVGETVAALTERGAELIEAPYPFGIEGTRAWLGAAADAFGISQSKVDAVRGAHGPRRARPRPLPRAARRQAHQLPAGFAARDPARALPARECGMELVEVGVPYLDRRMMGAELDCCPALRLTEGQDLEPSSTGCAPTGRT
jgi:light-independent protochlorophyllide reductase subunit N